MLCGVRVIDRNVLKHVHVMREGVRSAVAIIVYRTCFREYEVQGIFPLHSPSVTVDCRQLLPIFTIKILNSSARGTHSANRYPTTKIQVSLCYQWSYHF